MDTKPLPDRKVNSEEGCFSVRLLMLKVERWEQQHHRTAMMALVHPLFMRQLRMDMHRNDPTRRGVPFDEYRYLGRVILNGIEVVEAEIEPHAVVLR
jgi:hypothetical protein